MSYSEKDNMSYFEVQGANGFRILLNDQEYQEYRKFVKASK